MGLHKSSSQEVKDMRGRLSVGLGVVFAISLARNNIIIAIFLFPLQEEEEGWKMAPSSFVPAIDEGTDTYKCKQLFI